MKLRGLSLAVAFSLAAVAAMTVFLYAKGVKETAESGGDKMRVLVAQEDIPAGTELTELASSAFELEEFPEETVVRDAITDPALLEGQVTSTAVLAGEQMSAARLQGNETLPGGVLGIPEGYSAMTVAVDTPRVAGGAIQRGDHVTIYGTFRDVGSDGGGRAGVTANLVPDAEVLKVQGPGTDPATGAVSEGTMVTLALEPKDAQKVVFAQEQGTVYFGLLPPGEEGTSSKPLDLMKVLR